LVAALSTLPLDKTRAKRLLTTLAFNTTGMATGPTSTLETITVTATMTFSDTYASSNHIDAGGNCHHKFERSMQL